MRVHGAGAILGTAFGCVLFAGCRNGGTLPREESATRDAMPTPREAASKPAFAAPSRGPRSWVILPPRVRVSDIKVDGKLTRAIVEQALLETYGRLRLCYEYAARHEPDLEGRMAVKLVVDSYGQVVEATPTGSNLPGTDLVTCVMQGFAYGRFVLPALRPGGAAFAIEFSPPQVPDAAE
jgi:hypothetical protein